MNNEQKKELKKSSFYVYVEEVWEEVALEDLIDKFIFQAKQKERERIIDDLEYCNRQNKLHNWLVKIDFEKSFYNFVNVLEELKTNQ